MSVCLDTNVLIVTEARASLLIGVVLVADGVGQHISKGYIYFAVAFSLCVEILNLRARAKQNVPVNLHRHGP